MVGNVDIPDDVASPTVSPDTFTDIGVDDLVTVDNLPHENLPIPPTPSVERSLGTEDEIPLTLDPAFE